MVVFVLVRGLGGVEGALVLGWFFEVWGVVL